MAKLKFPVDPETETHLSGDAEAETINLDTLNAEETQLQVGSMTLPLPLSGPDQTDVLDIEGTKRKITLKGRKVDTFANLLDFRQQFETIIDGDQARTTKYINEDSYPSSDTSYSKGGGVDTKIIDFSITINQGQEPNAVYEMTLLQANQ